MSDFDQLELGASFVTPGRTIAPGAGTPRSASEPAEAGASPSPHRRAG